MFRTLLFLSIACNFIAPSAFAGYTIIGAEGDKELLSIANTVAQSHKSFVPKDSAYKNWKTKEISYSSEIADNVDGGTDSKGFAQPSEIDDKLGQDGKFTIIIQRLPDGDTIECNLVRQDTTTLGEVGSVHRFYNKMIRLQKAS